MLVRVVMVLWMLCVLAGCSTAQLDPKLTEAVALGRYSGARVKFQQDIRKDGNLGDRDYILNRSRLLILTLADGSPDAAEEVANQTFSLLRTQGVNADRTIRSVVFSDGLRIWKGEPFEQAMAFSYISIQKAMKSEWDNSRAAAQASLFLLKDFGESQQKKPLSTEDLARRAASLEASKTGAGDAYLESGYTAAPTNFTLGYLLTGVAAKALGRDEEASENLTQAARIRPGLAPLTDAIRAGRGRTILIVERGRGPTKVATGPDGAIAAFVAPPMQEGNLTVLAGTELSDGGRVPLALSTRQLALDHRWNNLEDVRRAKSLLGNTLLIGGAAVAIGAEDDEAKLAGAGAALAGLLLKAGARADTRHNEFLPGEVYVATADVTVNDTTLVLEVAGSGRILLPAVDPPQSPQGYQLLFVRIPSAGVPAWMSTGRVVYANDRYSNTVEGDGLPFIMGGRCVRRPTPEVFAEYQAAGYLNDLTLVELENLYREEGITFEVVDQQGESRKHILEGGNSLVCPLAGTTGYNRLMCQTHPAYVPRSAALRRVVESLSQSPKRSSMAQATRQSQSESAELTRP